MNWLKKELDSKTESSTSEQPGIYDLINNAEAGSSKRLLNRYLMPRDYDRSIKLHKAIGAPIVRKLVLKTDKRKRSSKGGSNYRLDATKSKIEAATSFAVGGSVYNEAAHSAIAMPTGAMMTDALLEGKFGTGAMYAGITGANLALVSLQRYNRARMLKRADEELASGATFSPGYKNWLGVDHRATRNYHNTNKQSTIEANPEQPDETVHD